MNQSSPTAAPTPPMQAFIDRWQGVSASELATAQSFIIDLCDVLGLDKPHPTPAQDYMFERPVTFSHGDGSTSAGRIDCYKRGHFVLEAKKLKAGRHTKGFDDGLLRARSQAEGYARALPAAEGRPPFLLVVDVGTVIEVYAEFSRTGGTYTPFPDPRSHRLALADLLQPEVQERLRGIWSAPDSLNPARISAQVTREVAALLARLSQLLEGSGSTSPLAPQVVAAYLTRCLFSMFAEDVELLPKGAFLGLLQTHRDDPATLQQMLRILWADMDKGGFSAALAKPVLHFNGKLFKGADTAGYSLLLTPAQIDLLIAAAQANWREVEPAIFGTMLERALDPAERHALGAHYTPRAYVERLVLPTVIEPLRADWANAQAAALVLAHEAAQLDGKAAEAKLAEARAEVKKFHHQLCTIRVLDPACGSANFLYVTLEHLKRLEGEVFNQLQALGQTQDQLGFEGETVTLQQLRGIELNERAAALAELVLWIGFLQWHIRTYGNASVAEPVVHNYGNIECRDAVLAWDAQEPAYNEAGQLLSRWDGVTFKTHPVTGEPVPDEAAQVPQWRYVGARRAQWPQADFVVGNPPFIGASTMRAALGDGYVQALRGAWPEVPESADFVMYWWHHAAQQVANGQTRRMGLITTNSLRQTFNRRVVQAALDGGLVGVSGGGDGAGAAVGGSVGAGYAGGLILPKAQKLATGTPHPNAGAAGGRTKAAKTATQAQPTYLALAIPDHPWVDGANGAAVRIAMTVVALGAGEGCLQTVTDEQPGEHGEMLVNLAQRTGLIHADLSVGANVASAHALNANQNLSNRGVQLFGAGFIVEAEQAIALGDFPLIRHYRNGRDLTDKPRGVMVIDAFGLTAEELRDQQPAAYQWLLENVKPERDLNNRESRRKNWWLFGETNPKLRKQLAGLPRYIATVETAKHRTFQFLDASILPDNKLIAIALNDAFHLGVLSSQLHNDWALAAGSTLEDRPVYVKTTCFETFPFPDEDTGLTPELRQRIATIAEQIDSHRKRVLGQVGVVGGDLASAASMSRTPPPPAPALPTKATITLTGIYNTLAALREGRPLTAKEKALHQQGLVGILRELHDELDTAVLAAYGWSDLHLPLDTDTLLQRLVELNAQRGAEEAQGRIRWLRPAFQNPQAATELPAQVQQVLDVDTDPSATALAATTKPAQQPWPATLPEQVRAVAQVLAASPAPLTQAHIEAHFKGRGPWKKGLPTLLQTLEALGRAQATTIGGIIAWR